MRVSYIVSDEGRRGAEISADGIGTIEVWKRKVTRSQAGAFDLRMKNITSQILKLSEKIWKTKKEDEAQRLTEEMFDLNTQFIVDRLEGITPAQIAELDVLDVGEISKVANAVFEKDFAAKKNV